MWWWWWLACRVPEPASDLFTVARDGERPTLATDGVTTWVAWSERRDDAITPWVLPLPPVGIPRGLPTLDPVVGIARKPRLAAHGGRLAAVWSTGDTRRSTVALSESVDGAPFEPAQVLAVGDADGFPTLVDQPEPFFVGDELWVAWKAEVDHPTVSLMVGWEGTGFAPVGLAPFPGSPCECCPHRLATADDGDLMLTLRNDDRDLREIWFARGDPTSLAFRPVQVSRTGWRVQGCPFDGPSLAQRGDELLITWVDPTRGIAEPWVSRSVDGGASWGPDEPLFEAGEGLFQEPVAAAFGDAWWVVVEEVFVGARLLRDHGDGWQEVAVPVPLFDVELVANPRELWLVGSDDDGAVRAVRYR